MVLSVSIGLTVTSRSVTVTILSFLVLVVMVVVVVQQEHHSSSSVAVVAEAFVVPSSSSLSSLLSRSSVPSLPPPSTGRARPRRSVQLSSIPSSSTTRFRWSSTDIIKPTTTTARKQQKRSRKLYMSVTEQEQEQETVTSVASHGIDRHSDDANAVATADDSSSSEDDPSLLLLSAWQILAGNIGTCMVAAESKKDDGFDGAATGWRPWVEEKSAFLLQQCIDKLIFQQVPVRRSNGSSSSSSSSSTTSSHESYVRWIRWMKATPSPLTLDMTDLLRGAVEDILTDEDFDLRIDQSRSDFLERISCRIYVLPSGYSLNHNLRSAPGSMIYGKVLFGGVTRYRLLGNTAASNQHSSPTSDFKRPPRRAGERTVISTSDKDSKPTPGWLQYGGPERCYTAVDIGPAAFMEIILLPKSIMHKWDDDTVRISSANDPGNTMSNNNNNFQGDMVARGISPSSLDPNLMFFFPSVEDTVDATEGKKSNTSEAQTETIYSNSHDGFSHHYTNNDLENVFSSVLGGLQTEIRAIIRRVLEGRFHADPTTRAEEMQTLLDLGLSPVRGLLLYGDPGCGKTALAREISRLLTDRPPKVVSAPELLDRWIGGSEKLVRDLFADAEAELRACNGDITKSGLHVIIIDELDAVFRKRSASDGAAEVTRASAVNQILVKLDGVNALGNILVIGTTNRRELLDPALQRPGRLEVAVHVPRPDAEGRRQILQIYFGPLRDRGRLSQPLCRAIDGSSNVGLDRDGTITTISGSKRSRIKRLASSLSRRLVRSERKIVDLAADRWTGGFSGAEIEGLVRCAGSIALSRARRDGSGVDGLIITLEDVARALDEVKN